MASGQRHLYEFGRFALDAENRLLLREGEPVPLQPKAVDTLLLLVERRGEVLSKDELMQRLWPDSFVEESNLSQNIYVLRKALGQEAGGGEYIKTVPKRGYRFAADVRELLDADGGDLTVEEQTRTRITITQEDRPSPQEDPRPASPVGEGGKNLPAVAPGTFVLRRKALALSLGVLLLCGLAALGYFRLAPGRGRAAARPRTVAVLPFKRLSPAEGDEYLGTGLCDVLITKLSGLRRLVVRPTSAVLKYDGAGADTLAAGRELQVESVLEGSIQHSGERVRVTVRLIDVADGAPLWAETFDEHFSDLFKVQDAIAGRVAQALVANLGSGDRELLAKRYTENGEAYQFYVKGRYFWNKRTERDMRKSIEYYQQAIAIDPSYALAYTGIADAYTNLSMGYNFAPTRPELGLPQAKEAALHALAIDDALPEAHVSLGVVKERWDWDFAGAEREYKRAIELNPDYATAHHRYSVFFGAMGRFDEAVAEIERARQLDPLSLVIAVDSSRPYTLSGRYDRAVEILRKVLEMDPNFQRAHHLLGINYSLMGRHEEAIAEIQKAFELVGGQFREDGTRRINDTLAVAYARAGRKSDALKILAEMDEPEQERKYLYDFTRAAVYAELGDKEQAFKWLERAYAERSPAMPELKVAPSLDPIRDDPRFDALVRRVGLTP